MKRPKGQSEEPAIMCSVCCLPDFEKKNKRKSKSL